MTTTTTSTSTGQYAELMKRLKDTQNQLRDYRVQAFRLAVVGIRNKRMPCVSDQLISKAYDMFLDLQKSPVCDVEDIDDILDLANQVVNLDKICEENLKTVEVTSIKPLDKAVLTPTKKTDVDSGAPGVFDPTSVTGHKDEMEGLRQYLMSLIRRSVSHNNTEPLRSLFQDPDFFQQHDHPELVDLMYVLMYVLHKPSGKIMAMIADDAGLLSDTWRSRLEM